MEIDVNKPTKEEIKKFLEVFDTLNEFEASQRRLRGYGALNENELPIPEVLKVYEWLENLRNSKSKTVK